MLGGGITVSGAGTSKTVVAITGNQITGAVQRAIAVDTAGTAYESARGQIGTVSRVVTWLRWPLV